MADRPLGTAHSPTSRSQEHRETGFIVDISLDHPVSVHMNHGIVRVNTQESESVVSGDPGVTLSQNSQDDKLLDQPSVNVQTSERISEDSLKSPIRDKIHPSRKDDKSTTASTFIHRWYFMTKDKELPLPVQQLELVCAKQEPLRVNIIANTLSQRIEWQIPVKDIPPASYEVVLGISSCDLDLDAVDSISIDIDYSVNQPLGRPCEVIPSSALQCLFTTTRTENNNHASIARVANNSTVPAANNADPTSTHTGNSLDGGYLPDDGHLVRLKLHENITVESSTNDGTVEAIKVSMTIECWRGVSSYLGGIGLHFMELHSNSDKVYQNDPTYKTHNPFTWFIDIGTGLLKDVSREIISYIFSGDGCYIALLIHSNSGQDLELYRIEQDRASSPLVASWTLSPSKTIEFDISISWNASQIVVLDFSNHELSTTFNRHHRRSSTDTSMPTTSGYFEEQYSIGRLPSILRTYRTRGTFYASTRLRDIIKNELFVAFDGSILNIYKVHGNWEVFKTMTLGEQRNHLGDLSDQYPNWKEHLRGGRLVLPNAVRGYISTWFLWKVDEKVVAMDIPTVASENHYIDTSLSAHGELLAMATNRMVDIYLTETWTRLGTWFLPSDESSERSILSVDFMSGYGRLMISTSPDSDSSNRSYGYIIDIDTMTTVDRINCRKLSHYSRITLDTTFRSASMLLQKDKVTLGGIRHTDRLVRSSSRAATKCTSKCTSNLAFRQTSPSELQAEVVTRTFGPPDRRKTTSVIAVTARNTKANISRKLTLPRPGGSKLVGVNRFIVQDYSYLVVVMSSLVLVWGTPVSVPTEGVQDLLSAIVTTADTEWTVCQHHQLYQRDQYDGISVRSLLTRHIYNPEAFLDGVLRLVEIFKDADEMSKSAITRYVERHINQRLDSKDDSASVLACLCASWTAESHEHLLAFIVALFESPSFRWIPAPAMTSRNNPISILIDLLDSSIVVMDIIEVVASYCIRQAKAESDLRFLNPVFVSLRAALKYRDIDSGLLTRAVRSFAYFPARDYHFVMDHYSVASSFYRWPRWRLLHKQKDPILQTSCTRASEESLRRFTPHLYVASFDMLWSTEDIAVPRNRFIALCQRFLLFITSTSRRQYIRRPLELDDLDNPALVALVRFKWMKIGFTYWLLKTIVLTYMVGYFLGAVVSGLYERSIITWVTFFTSTIEVMLIGLWLTVVSCVCDILSFTFFKVKTRDAWFEFFDCLFVFALSVAFLKDDDLTWRVTDGEDGYQYVISFTILLVLLRLLIRFRVMKTVGSYLSIIKRTVRSIWVFVLIFACTIMAFTIVLLYIQYVVCQDNSCWVKDASGNMERLEPEGFFVALSSTYYITAGSFDSMQRVLKTGDWMLRFMLIIFVFTTTIMLNILIGLVNHAFDNDDRISKFEWLENRMLWVTSAENLLRGVPFFKSKDWFPEKIYYTATPQQVRKYRQESQRLSKSSAAAALPLDSNLQGKPDSHAATSSDQQDAQQQEQENLMIDQMRELKDQLESQKRQSDEQIRQLQTQLSDILAILRSGQKQA